MWYFTLTGIHLLHVVFGTSLLTYLWVRVPAPRLQQLATGRAGMRRFLLAPGGPVVDCDLPLALPTEGSLMSVLRERVTGCGWA